LFFGDVDIAGRPGMALRASGGRIVAVGPSAELAPEAGDEVVTGHGGALIPGLHDHHVHLLAAAAAAGSVPAGPPQVSSERHLVDALRAAPEGGDAGRWIRAVGYHESVAGPLDRIRLDGWVPQRPLRVQHRSGALWMLNSAALGLLGAAHADHPGIERDPATGEPTGRLWRADAWLAQAAGARGDADLALRAALGALSREAAAWGITGFTDADPRRTPADLAMWLDRCGGDNPTVLQRLHLMGPLGLAPTEGLDLSGSITVGPVKVLLDDTDLPTPGDLAATVTAAHGEGRPVAVHCVTRLQLLVTLAAFADAGTRPGDRIEHGSLIPSELIPELRRLGLTVVTQPNFVAERGDHYLTDVEVADRADLYRCRSLLDAGVAVAFGTDRPYGGADPWAAIDAAITRRTAAGSVLLPSESVDPGRALSAFLGHPDLRAIARHLAPGQPADLCLLDRPIPAAAPAGPARQVVLATVVEGRLAYQV
jgi:predicted amidohydrolase YtcJ